MGMGMPLPLRVVRQVVTDGSGCAAQFIDRLASNRKIAKSWFDRIAVSV